MRKTLWLKVKWKLGGSCILDIIFVKKLYVHICNITLESNFGLVNGCVSASVTSFLPFWVFCSECGLDLVLEIVNVTFKRCDFFCCYLLSNLKIIPAIGLTHKDYINQNSVKSM